jgi:hypothetical protein
LPNIFYKKIDLFLSDWCFRRFDGKFNQRFKHFSLILFSTAVEKVWFELFIGRFRILSFLSLIGVSLNCHLVVQFNSFLLATFNRAANQFTLEEVWKIVFFRFVEIVINFKDLVTYRILHWLVLFLRIFLLYQESCYR